jgi:WD40 repeat protein
MPLKTRLYRQLTGHIGDGTHPPVVRSVAFSSDGSLLASGGLDGTIRVWEASTGSLVRTLQSQSKWVYGVAFSPCGDVLVSISRKEYSGEVMLWNLTTGHSLWRLPSEKTVFSNAVFTPDGAHLILRSPGSVQVREVQTKAIAQDFTTGGSLYAVSWRKSMLACSSLDHKKITLWDLTASHPIRTLLLFPFEKGPHWPFDDLIADGRPSIECVAFSDDGSVLAAGGETKSAKPILRVWNTEAGELKKSHVGDKKCLMIAFSPDGRTMAVADVHGVDLWSTLTWTLEQRIAVSPASAVSVAFSPDGQTLATAGMAEAISLWKLEK